MASKVQVCNMALARLGADTITSLTDNTRTAKLCNTFFDQVVDEVLKEGPWATAVRRSVLAQTTNTPAYGYTYEYQLPTSPFCLQVLDIDEGTVGDTKFVIESDKLLTDATTMSIRYIARLTDVQGFGPFLTEAVSAKMAAELAYPLTGSAETANRFRDIAARTIALSLSKDGLQGSGDQVASTDLLDIR